MSLDETVPDDPEPLPDPLVLPLPDPLVEPDPVVLPEPLPLVEPELDPLVLPEPLPPVLLLPAPLVLPEPLPLVEPDPLVLPEPLPLVEPDPLALPEPEVDPEEPLPEFEVEIPRSVNALSSSRSRVWAASVASRAANVGVVPDATSCSARLSSRNSDCDSSPWISAPADAAVGDWLASEPIWLESWVKIASMVEISAAAPELDPDPLDEPDPLPLDEPEADDEN
jgi:hypothetical protein